ncbi:hypothetical protein V6N13_015060 [Hibiscus sabdariffa]|uniref:Uncharacterized protein n=1 Tax=Hibiscus sabdariffa TaxID=183260 RepID=A0ABR2RXC8_9ROSI
MYISWHVTFNEHIFPFAASSCTTECPTTIPHVPSFPYGFSLLPTTEAPAATTPVTTSSVFLDDDISPATAVFPTGRTGAASPAAHDGHIVHTVHADTTFPDVHTDITSRSDHADTVLSDATTGPVASSPYLGSPPILVDSSPPTTSSVPVINPVATHTTLNHHSMITCTP